MPCVKSSIPSAVVSIDALISNSELVLFSVLYDAVVNDALDVPPVIVSGTVKVPDLLITIKVLVELSNDLTSAVTLDVPPVTVSPTVNVPDPPATRPTVIAFANAVSIASRSVIPVSISSSLYSNSSH